MAICCEGIFRLCGISSKEIAEKAANQAWQAAQEAAREAMEQQAAKDAAMITQLQNEVHTSKLFWRQKSKDYWLPKNV